MRSPLARETDGPALRVAELLASGTENPSMTVFGLGSRMLGSMGIQERQRRMQRQLGKAIFFGLLASFPPSQSAPPLGLLSMEAVRAPFCDTVATDCRQARPDVTLKT